METERIDKLDAACRQLNTAISLWFSSGDSISIHTLACSAHQIVHDINQKKGGRDLIYDTLIVKERYLPKAREFFKRAYNFFKHADKDADTTIEFNASLTEFFIAMTSLGLEILGRQPDIIRDAFTLYYGLKNPDLLTKKGKSGLFGEIPEDKRKQALSISKQQFFECYTSQRRQYLRNSEHSGSVHNGDTQRS